MADIDSTNEERRAPALAGRENAAFVSWLHLGTELAAISSCAARRCQFTQQTESVLCEGGDAELVELLKQMQGDCRRLAGLSSAGSDKSW